MALKLIQKTGSPPIELELLKETLSLPKDNTRYDTLLQKAIDKAIDMVEAYTARTIVDKVWCYSHNHHVLYLPKPKIQAIHRVISGGELVPKSDYKIGYTRDSWVVALGVKYGTKLNSVEYSAGYGNDVPDVLVNVMYDCARHLFQQGVGGSLEATQQASEFIQNMLKGSEFSSKVFLCEKVDLEQTIAVNEALCADQQ